MNKDITSGSLGLSRKIKFKFLLFILMTIIISDGDNALAEGNFPILFNTEDLTKYSKSNTVILDARSHWRFFLGHIPGAINLPNWKDFTEVKNGVPGIIIKDLSTLAHKISALGIDKHKNIIIYGDTKDPWRTDGRFLWMFHYLGFNNTSILEGGFELWQKKGNKIERGQGSRVKKSKFTAKNIKLNNLVIANKDWINERLNDSNLSIIDTRTLKEFKGATPYGSKKGGHIPGALNVDWRVFFNEEGLLKNRNSLIKILKNYNITADKDIVVYCTGGVRSAMAYFVLKYLGFKARNYDGSWWDWSSAQLPTEL